MVCYLNWSSHCPLVVYSSYRQRVDNGATVVSSSWLQAVDGWSLLAERQASAQLACQRLLSARPTPPVSDLIVCDASKLLSPPTHYRLTMVGAWLGAPPPSALT